MIQAVLGDGIRQYTRAREQGLESVFAHRSTSVAPKPAPSTSRTLQMAFHNGGLRAMCVQDTLRLVFEQVARRCSKPIILNSLKS